MNYTLFLLFIFLSAAITGTNNNLVFAQKAEEQETAIQPITVKSDSTSKDSVNLILPGGQVKKIVKRDFDPKQQVLVGTLIMSFLLIIITTSTNWNP